MTLLNKPLDTMMDTLAKQIAEHLIVRKEIESVDDIPPMVGDELVNLIQAYMEEMDDGGPIDE